MGDLIHVRDLTVSFKTRHESILAVNRLNFELKENQILGIVGESGSGKSQTVLSIMGLLEQNGYATGDAKFNGVNLLSLSKSEINRIRGKEIGMIFQDPMSSLNPYITIGSQMGQILAQHSDLTRKEREEKCVEMLDSVGIVNPRQRFDGYSFELSGGMRQRVMIASALLTSPKLLIADEPTTALDVTVQEKILDLILEVRDRFDMSVILITHDLGVVARTCEKVLVMKQGQLQEQGEVDQIYYSPKNEYTRELLNKSRRINLIDSKDLDGKDENEREEKKLVEAKEVSVLFNLPKESLLAPRKQIAAVNKVSAEVWEGEILGVVGESGSGKSTFSRTILGLQKVTSGELRVLGQDLNSQKTAVKKTLRKRMQVVFQDPYSSLNPRMTIQEILLEPLLVFFSELDRGVHFDRIRNVLVEVGLDERFLGRYPHELSGGQCQRVAISRALLPIPELLVCDEAVSALDASVRAEIIDLLVRLKSERGLTIVFIAHDLAVVRKICDRVIVMEKGKVVEQGDTETVFQNPKEDYTKNLISAVPIADPRFEKDRRLERMSKVY
tara:strand:+ start:224 stop:1894 length:1671 start_codon:yes stop_codon:yes gene_type:complete